MSNAIASVLRAPHVLRLLTVAIIGRLPTGMTALAVILLVRGHGGSYALAGLLTASFSLSAAVGRPLAGRLVDRFGQPLVLVASAGVALGGFAGVAATHTRLPAAAAACAALAGAGTPPLEPCLRSLWPDLLRRGRHHHLETAYALDSALQEVIFVTGPLLALAAVALGGDAGGVVACGLLGLAGAVPFALSAPSRAWRGAPRTAGWAGPLRSRGLVLVVAALALTGVALGALSVALPAYAEAAGSRPLGGWLLATQALGALTGGLLYGVRRWPDPPQRRLAGLLLGLGAGYLPLAALPPPPAMLPLALLSGLLLAPVMACAFVLVDALAPSGTITEAFAWTETGVLAGIAAGAALGGLAVTSGGPRLALAVAAAAPLLAALTVHATTRTLNPSDQDTQPTRKPDVSDA